MDEQIDPATARAIIDAQKARVRTGAYTDERVIFGVWAVAWIVGYGLLWSVSRTQGSAGIRPWTWAVFGLCIISAVAVTLVHSLRRLAGVAGVSRTTGQLYGWSWFVAFLTGQAMVAGLSNAGLSDDAMTLAANGVSALIVAILYMAGGALWQDRSQFWIGVWMALTSAAATVVGLPHTFAVMALAGGGGFLVGAVLAQAGRVRGRAAARGAAA